MIGPLQRLAHDYPYRSRLIHANSMEFERLVEHCKPPQFLFYREAAPNVAIELQSVLNFLSISPKQKRFLDIGPAYGATRELWIEQGGADWQYIERDLWCFHRLRLQGASGWHGDHFSILPKLPESSFDVVWCKGAITPHSPQFLLSKANRLRRWVQHAMRLVSPQGLLILCPYWLTRDVDQHWFAKTLDEAGLQRTKPIPHHNSAVNYPVTWVYDRRQGSRP